MAKRRQRPEQVAQIAVVEFLRRALPRTAVVWHTPNGGKRTPAEAGIFKAMGVLAGFPDIAILYQGTLYVAEMKAGKRGATDAQDATITALQRGGARFLGIWTSVNDADAECRRADLPMYARPMAGGGWVREGA